MVLLAKEFIIAYFPFLLYGKYVALATGKARPKATLAKDTQQAMSNRSEANRTVYLYPAIDFASIYILISCNYLWLCLALLSGHRQTCVCIYVPVCVRMCVFFVEFLSSRAYFMSFDFCSEFQFDWTNVTADL